MYGTCTVQVQCTTCIISALIVTIKGTNSKTTRQPVSPAEEAKDVEDLLEVVTLQEIGDVLQEALNVIVTWL